MTQTPSGQAGGANGPHPTAGLIGERPLPLYAQPVPGTPESGHGPHVDDELVRALFPRLSRLIKAELRLDRERAGFLINTRH
jgi:hypothetical protein